MYNTKLALISLVLTVLFLFSVTSTTSLAIEVEDDCFHTAVINEYFKLDEGVNPNRFEFNLVITDGIPAGIDFCPYCGRRLIVRNVEIVHM